MKLLILVVCAALAGCAGASQQVMKQLSESFTKAWDECKNEHSLPDSVQEDLMNFWKEDFVLTNRATGCAIMCLSGKMNIHDSNGKLHQENAKNFAKTHGADDAMAQTLIDTIHKCEAAAPDTGDACVTVLEIAKCFKAEMHKLNWAPSLDMIAEV